MDLDAHLDAIWEALDRFATCVGSASAFAPVPTTPGWTVRDLVAHQGMVHRWATATILGEDVDPEALVQQGLTSQDPVAWLCRGADGLVATLADAPADLAAPVFLRDAPPPRAFWARRQCHETTIHAVDALAAALGRMPRAADTWISCELAVDGIDELLTGFLPRPGSRFRSARPTVFAVLPDDAAERWLVETFADRPPLTTRGAGDADADVVLRGSAASLYLALWNRTDEVTADGFELWAERVRVVWS